MAYGAPQPMTYGAPQPMAYGAPQQQPVVGYGAPQQQQIRYGAPQQQPVVGYGAPQQQAVRYGAPQPMAAYPSSSVGYGGATAYPSSGYPPQAVAATAPSTHSREKIQQVLMVVGANSATEHRVCELLNNSGGDVNRAIQLFYEAGGR